MRFKVGDKIISILNKDKGEIGEIVAINGLNYVIKGFTSGSRSSLLEFPGCYDYADSLIQKYEPPKPKEEFIIVYDEPIEDEFNDNCLATCKPGQHNCVK